MIVRRPPDDAPFRHYNKTDEQAFAEGRARGLTWPVRWNHIPGGPYYLDNPDKDSHPDWIEYCRLLKRHNALYLQGWHQGIKEACKTNPALRKMISGLVYGKLSG